MTLTRKGSRRITVDGVAYRWIIRRKPTYSDLLRESATPEFGSPLQVAVERATDPGAVLIIASRRSRRTGVFDLPADAVAPHDIGVWIRAAINEGWQPSEAGPPFKYIPA